MQDQPISWLMFFTLAAGLVIVAGVFLNFIKSRSNREIAENTLEGNGRSHGAARDGALPELLGLAAVALIAMGLLTVGQNSKPSVETAQLPGPVGSTATQPRASTASDTTTPTTTGANNGMMQNPGSFNQPKNYQPTNPAPDPRAAPTGSDAGVGSSPGNTGTPTK